MKSDHLTVVQVDPHPTHTLPHHTTALHTEASHRQTSTQHITTIDLKCTDRSTKQSLPLAKLTNLSSEWNVG